MANRILRDYTDSLSVNELSEGAETFFVRLMMKADDFGKFHGNPKLLRASLYPLRDSVTEKKILAWLEECVKNRLINKYSVNNRDFIQIINFGQRLRAMRSEYPDPEFIINNDSNPQTIVSELRSNDSNTPPETKRNEVETETETETKAVDTEPDVWDDLMKKWIAYRKEKKKPLTPTSIPLALAELKKMSGEKIDVAQQIVNKSISNGWQGLFALDQKKLTPTSTPIMKNGKFGKL